MSERSDAVRYARELFDVTWRHEQADTVAEELETIVHVLDERSAEMRPLLHPLVPKASKVATIRTLAQRAALSRPTAVLLEALAHHSRLSLLPAITAAFRQRLNQKKGVVRAEVTTAAPITAAQAEALATQLAEVIGRQVTLATRVDPSIIGGVVTQIGSTVYDGSVTRQLARMREKLVENV